MKIWYRHREGSSEEELILTWPILQQTMYAEDSSVQKRVSKNIKTDDQLKDLW